MKTGDLEHLIDFTRHSRKRCEERISDRTYVFDSLQDLDRSFDDAFAVLDARGEAHLLEELCPYFGVLWPSAVVLAKLLAERPMNGQRVLEIGCGLALPSMVAAAAGAIVLATDTHPATKIFLEHNLQLNELESHVGFLKLDWRNFDRNSIGEFDLIIGSDLLYDLKQPLILANFLVALKCPKTEIIIVDPDRPYRQDFCNAMQEKGVELTNLSKVPLTDQGSVGATIMTF